MYSIENFSFRYPDSEKNILSNINLEIEKGSFITIFGDTGSGKSTLLKNLKTVLTPSGEKFGRILFNGVELEEITNREQVSKIGFVFQSPDDQIVTDKVWHELAFGLENLGYESEKIRLRVAEIASFFGMQKFFEADVNTLSGGQKQLLNLASALVMEPEVLILDEPTSQLDIIAANEFLNILKRVNDEFGTTIILTEHRLDNILGITDRVIGIKEGNIVLDTVPRELAKSMVDIDLLPNLLKIYKELNIEENCPITVNEGKRYFSKLFNGRSIQYNKIEEKDSERGEIVLKAKNISFSYEKDKKILNDISMNFEKGKVYAIIGGNGTGKSTLLSVISGVNKPDRGKIITNKKCLCLPQNPQTLFTGKTVREEIEIVKDSNKINEIIDKLELNNILDRHPYDLSGGEMQKVALAKILLLDPEILILDEPTKGIDNRLKSKLAKIIKELKITAIMASHDIEFCAENADICMMLFNGEIVSQDITQRFFSENTFYTTVSSRISKGVFENAVTIGDVVELCKKNQVKELSCIIGKSAYYTKK